MKIGDKVQFVLHGEKIGNKGTVVSKNDIPLKFHSYGWTFKRGDEPHPGYVYVRLNNGDYVHAFAKYLVRAKSNPGKVFRVKRRHRRNSTKRTRRYSRSKKSLWSASRIAKRLRQIRRLSRKSRKAGK